MSFSMHARYLATHHPIGWYRRSQGAFDGVCAGPRADSLNSVSCPL